MKTDEEIDKEMDEVEDKILAILKKSSMSLGLLYHEGGCVMLCHIQNYPSGDTSVRERQFD